MQVGNYPTRNFATLGPLWLRPPFTRGYNHSLNHILFAFWHRAGVRPYTSFYNLAKPCVFSKQSLPPALCHQNEVAPNFGTPSPEVTESFCRVPSVQFSHNAFVCSTNSPEVVFGTVISKEAFSRNHSATIIIHLKSHSLTDPSLSFGRRIKLLSHRLQLSLYS
jgi:hypothetical protein